jgi:hypothetical protein
MPETRDVEFAVMNVAAEPHRNVQYSRLLRSISRRPRPFWGDDFAAITEPEEYEPGIFLGTVLIWQEIDPNKPAVNKDTLQEVRMENTGIRIPANLGLNGRHFFYVLRERDHKVFYESKNDEGHQLAPSRFKRLLDLAFAPVNLRGELSVTVTVVPDEDGLSKVLAIPHITMLQIFLAAPNPDQIEGIERRVLKRLTDQGAKSQEIIFSAKSRKAGIRPNRETLEDAQVAADNGLVTATGYDNGGNKLPTRSTDQYPKVFPYTIEAAGSALAGLLRIAKQAVIRDGRRPPRQ